MNNIIIICGHNHFASGLLSALEMIVGKKETIMAIDFEISESDLKLEEKIRKAVENFSDHSILFACDLMGGSPFKACSKIAFYKENYEVVTGINLGGLIDSSVKLQILDIHELAHNLVEASKKSVQIVEKKIEESDTEKEGI